MYWRNFGSHGLVKRGDEWMRGIGAGVNVLTRSKNDVEMTEPAQEEPKKKSEALRRK
jgi:hypothetical protein